VFIELTEVSAAETSLAPGDRLEAVHVHGVDDTSIHLCLPRGRVAEVVALGWAQPHQYGDFGTELLVYDPRTLEELDTVLALIRESLGFARAHN
jgi:hypothetical protein